MGEVRDVVSIVFVDHFGAGAHQFGDVINALPGRQAQGDERSWFRPELSNRHAQDMDYLG